MARRLPDSLRPLFWDTPFEDLDLDLHQGFVTDRLLSAGSWEQIRWLRREVGEAALRGHILHTRGRRLTPRQLRLWELVLDLPPAEVALWLRERRHLPWEARTRG